MKVYCVVLCCDEYGSRHLLDVYSNREEAEKHADACAAPKERLKTEPKQWSAYGWDHGYYVQEMDVLEKWEDGK